MRRSNTLFNAGSNKGPKNKVKIFLISGLLLLCSADNGFDTAVSAPLAFKTTPQHQLADFLKKEVSEISEQLLKDFPSNASVVRLSADFYWDCNMLSRTMTLLEQGLKYNPTDHILCSMLAQAAFDNAEYEKAVTFWKKALEISPWRWELHDNIAKALLYLGKYRQAVETLEEKIKASSPSARSYLLLGQCLLQLEKYERAKEYLEKTIKLYPRQSIMGYYYLAKVYMRLKQPDKARQSMETHTKLKAQIEKPQRDKLKEEDMLVIDVTSSTRLEVFPELLTEFCLLGNNLYMTEQNTEKAEELFMNGERVFQQAINISPDTPDIYRSFALMYIVANRKLTKAKKLADKAVALERSASNYFVLANYYYKVYDLTNALELVEKAIKLDPGNAFYKQIYNKIKKEMTQ